MDRAIFFNKGLTNVATLPFLEQLEKPIWRSRHTHREPYFTLPALTNLYKNNKLTVTHKSRSRTWRVWNRASRPRVTHGVSEKIMTCMRIYSYRECKSPTEQYQMPTYRKLQTGKCNIWTYLLIITKINRNNLKKWYGKEKKTEWSLLHVTGCRVNSLSHSFNWQPS